MTAQSIDKLYFCVISAIIEVFKYYRSAWESISLQVPRFFHQSWWSINSTRSENINECLLYITLKKQQRKVGCFTIYDSFPKLLLLRISLGSLYCQCLFYRKLWFTFLNHIWTRTALSCPRCGNQVSRLLVQRSFFQSIWWSYCLNSMWHLQILVIQVCTMLILKY